MSRNNQTNNLIKWIVILFDFLILGLILVLFYKYHPDMSEWRYDRVEVFVLVCFCSLVITEYQLPTYGVCDLDAYSSVVSADEGC